jgi:hypothetical protein
MRIQIILYPQTFIDIYSKASFQELYDRRNALVMVELLNDEVLPFDGGEGYHVHLAMGQMIGSHLLEIT